MSDWSRRSYTNGSVDPNKRPATAALDHLQLAAQRMKEAHPSKRINRSSHRGSLDSAMKMQLEKARFNTSDLFGSLPADGSDNIFPEIKWCTAEESQNNVMRLTSSSDGQLHQHKHQPQEVAVNGQSFPGGFYTKAKT